MLVLEWAGYCMGMYVWMCKEKFPRLSFKWNKKSHTRSLIENCLLLLANLQGAHSALKGILKLKKKKLWKIKKKLNIHAYM